MPSPAETIAGQPARRPELFPYLRDYLIRRGLIRPAQPPRPAVQRRAKCLKTEQLGRRSGSRSTPGVDELIELRQAQEQRQPAANVTVRIDAGCSVLLPAKSHRCSLAPKRSTGKRCEPAPVRVVPARGPSFAPPRCAGLGRHVGHGTITRRSTGAVSDVRRCAKGGAHEQPQRAANSQSTSGIPQPTPLAALRSHGGYRPHTGASSARPRSIRFAHGVAP